jgi:hypothetical protein
MIMSYELDMDGKRTVMNLVGTFKSCSTASGRLDVINSADYSQKHLSYFRGNVNFEGTTVFATLHLLEGIKRLEQSVKPYLEAVMKSANTGDQLERESCEGLREIVDEFRND